MEAFKHWSKKDQLNWMKSAAIDAYKRAGYHPVTELRGHRRLLRLSIARRPVQTVALRLCRHRWVGFGMKDGRFETIDDPDVEGVAIVTFDNHDDPQKFLVNAPVTTETVRAHLLCRLQQRQMAGETFNNARVFIHLDHTEGLAGSGLIGELGLIEAVDVPAVVADKANLPAIAAATSQPETDAQMFSELRDIARRYPGIDISVSIRGR